MVAGKAAQHFAMDIEKEQEVLMNLADIAHDPDEVFKKPVTYFDYSWRSK